MTVFVVEDDEIILDSLRYSLVQAGHAVTTAGSVQEALDCLARGAPFDLCLLDIRLPDGSGFQVCDAIRANSSVPILFLTAKTGEEDVVTGLGLGGDDYLTKPFRLAELRARVNAHLRRQSRTPRNQVRRGDLEFDLSGRTLSCQGQAIHLTKSEYEICQHLALRPGQTFTKEQLYEAVFGFDGTGDDSAITEHIKNIRAKLRAVGQAPIETVWGVGYKWKNQESGPWG